MIFEEIIPKNELAPATVYAQTEVITGTLWVMSMFDNGRYGFPVEAFYAGDGSGAGTDYPSESNVRDGVSYGSGTMTGNMTEPSENDVRDGVDYGAGGTEFTGNMTEPAESDVRIGVDYGSNGTEFTGTLSGGGESSYAFFS